MVPSTSVAAGTDEDRTEFSVVPAVAFAATGMSLVPVTVMVTVLATLTPPLLSVAVYVNVTLREAPTARASKSVPGVKV
jgi:hypothetical protein